MKVLLICNYKPGVGGISGQVEILQRHLRDEGYTAVVFSTKGPFLWRLGLFRRLRKAARKYDVMHIHCCSGWGILPAVVGVTVGRWLKKRVVLTYHGGGGEKFFDRHPRLVHHYLTRTDTNIVLSGFLAKVFEKHNLPYVIIPNILELDDSHFRLREPLKPNFICIRAHEPLYNIPCILRAFQTVQTDLPESTLTLVGDGTQHDALMAMTRDMALKNVIFTGRVANNEIYHYLDESDILLSSPIVDNMPVSLLEAMNAGLLVISSAVGGVPYMIENGQTGLLFDSNNNDQLAGLMLWAIGHPKETLAMTEQARKTLCYYSWNEVGRKIEEIYHK